jgi:hypothetical protein
MAFAWVLAEPAYSFLGAGAGLGLIGLNGLGTGTDVGS